MLEVVTGLVSLIVAPIAELATRVVRLFEGHLAHRTCNLELLCGKLRQIVSNRP